MGQCWTIQVVLSEGVTFAASVPFFAHCHEDPNLVYWSLTLISALIQWVTIMYLTT